MVQPDLHLSCILVIVFLSRNRDVGSALISGIKDCTSDDKVESDKFQSLQEIRNSKRSSYIHFVEG